MKRLCPRNLSRAGLTSHACLAATSQGCQCALEAPHEQDGLITRHHKPGSRGLLKQSNWRQMTLEQWQYHTLYF